MSNPKFDPKELEIVGETFGIGGKVDLYNFPVKPKQAFIGMCKRNPVWQITGVEQKLFTPMCIPDNIARAFVFESRPFDPNNGGGPDMFGIEWEYVPMAGGSMVRPGKPFMEDANEWYDKLVWPDPDKWDWEATAQANKDYLGEDTYNCMWFLTGWYERLISFMDFEGAIMAMVDEDQTDAVKALFDKLSDLYIKILDNAIKYMPGIDGFCIHDDWGSQKETFFSPAVAEEMIVPYMKKVTDFLHSKGKFCELHSCGQNLKQVPNMIKAGWDQWNPQPMNDTHKIYELYGDKIIVGVIPTEYDVDNSTEDQQRSQADAFVEKFCADPSKPCIVNSYASAYLTPAYRAELYEKSRIAYQDK